MARALEIVRGSHTYDAPGTYTVTVTVTDSNGAKATATCQITITTDNAPPLVYGIAPVGLDDFYSGQSITFLGVIYDGDAEDTLTAVWDWGDGSTTAHTVKGSGTER